jgi:hypothetical protein
MSVERLPCRGVPVTNLCITAAKNVPKAGMKVKGAHHSQHA